MRDAHFTAWLSERQDQGRHQLYACPRLMLLYPNHADPGREPGVQSHRRVNGNDHHLTVATLDLGSDRDPMELARLIASHPPTAPAGAALCCNEGVYA